MNFLAVTFDEPQVARAFVARYKFRWRVVPDAREFIDRMRVKQYPMMALFDAQRAVAGHAARRRARRTRSRHRGAAARPLGGRAVACQQDSLRAMKCVNAREDVRCRP